LEKATLTVTHQIQERDGRAVICLPKSAASDRVVPVDLATVAMLVRLRASQVRAGIYRPDGWVFARDNGCHWSPSYLTHTFRRLVAEADLPPVRYLRHGAASLSLAAGNDLKTVQALLGHASIVLTADVTIKRAPVPRTPARKRQPAWYAVPVTTMDNESSGQIRLSARAEGVLFAGQDRGPSEPARS
jgi:integrase